MGTVFRTRRSHIGGPTQWEVRYGQAGGFSAALSTGSEQVPAPFFFPSIGSVLTLMPNPSTTPPPVSEVALGREMLDGSVELYDMDGDGWADVVAPDGYGKLRDQGWESAPVEWGDDPAFASITRTVSRTTGLAAVVRTKAITMAKALYRYRGMTPTGSTVQVCEQSVQR